MQNKNADKGAFSRERERENGKRSETKIFMQRERLIYHKLKDFVGTLAQEQDDLQQLLAV